jgi:type I restriction enzyme M protein
VGAGAKTNLLFFTRGKPTEMIWYYDLSDRKVGKKTPLTANDCKEFLELLGAVNGKTGMRPDSERSWTVDFTVRRRKATEDSRPFRQIAAGKRVEANALKDTVSELKKVRPRDDGRIETVKIAIADANRISRDATNKAQSIEDAVYDLKAVNPNKKTEVDSRTPAELLDLIEAKGREGADAIAALRALGSAVGDDAASI